MTPPDLRRSPSEKLRFLAQIVRAEADLLSLTDGRLFAVPMDARRAARMDQRRTSVARRAPTAQPHDPRVRTRPRSARRCAQRRSCRSGVARRIGAHAGRAGGSLTWQQVSVAA